MTRRALLTLSVLSLAACGGTSSPATGACPDGSRAARVTFVETATAASPADWITWPSCQQPPACGACIGLLQGNVDSGTARVLATLLDGLPRSSVAGTRRWRSFDVRARAADASQVMNTRFSSAFDGVAAGDPEVDRFLSAAR